MSSYDVRSPTQYFSGIWRPRLRELLVFVALAVLGFLIWEINPSITLTNALGIDRATALEEPLNFFLLGLVEPALRCLVVLVVGFLFPRGFYLWGLAIAIHTPLSIFLLNRAAAQDGIEIIQGGIEGLLGYVVIEAMFTLMAAFFYTIFAGIGVLMRYLFEKKRAAGHP